MARVVLGSATPRKTAIVFVLAFATAVLSAPTARAQRAHPGGGHVGGGARAAAPVVVPHAAPVITRGATARPHGVPGAHLSGLGVSPVRFRVATFGGFRRPFFGGRFFRFVPLLGFNTLWSGCAPFVGWTFGCNALPYYPTGASSGFENYVTMENYGNPIYLYGGEERDLVWLYLKDGSAYAVTDYWFVNDEVHFASVAEGGARLRERVIGFDELDVPQTVDVNTTRGFRMVMRDEPWQKYLKDHPDSTPPPLTPQKN